MKRFQEFFCSRKKSICILFIERKFYKFVQIHVFSTITKTLLFFGACIIQYSSKMCKKLTSLYQKCMNINQGVKRK